jgi:hypothetical protein
MTSRITPVELKRIVDVGSMDDTAINEFITTANFVVNDNLKDAGYGDEKLKMIELFLSAHFVLSKNPTLKKRKIGDAEDEYVTSEKIQGLDSTTYGQTVLMLDTLGILSADQSSKSTIQVF